MGNIALPATPLDTYRPIEQSPAIDLLHKYSTMTDTLLDATNSLGRVGASLILEKRTLTMENRMLVIEKNTLRQTNQLLAQAYQLQHLRSVRKALKARRLTRRYAPSPLEWRERLADQSLDVAIKRAQRRTQKIKVAVQRADR